MVIDYNWINNKIKLPLLIKLFPRILRLWAIAILNKIRLVWKRLFLIIKPNLGLILWWETIKSDASPMPIEILGRELKEGLIPKKLMTKWYRASKWSEEKWNWTKIIIKVKIKSSKWIPCYLNQASTASKVLVLLSKTVKHYK